MIGQKVLSSLDKRKKESGGARDAIRWIEAQAARGSKFVRSAKPNEYRVIQDIDGAVGVSVATFYCIILLQPIKA